MKVFTKFLQMMTLLLLISSVALAQSNVPNLPIGGDRLNPVVSDQVAPAQILPNTSLKAVTDFSEGFDDITTLTGAGWAIINNSQPIGTTTWFQGNETVFPAQAGSATSYIGVNFNSTAGTGTISNWLLTPETNLSDGDIVSFWTRCPDASSWPDRLELRLSTNGSSTDVGTTATSVGVFTTLLLSVNPNLTVGGYPEVWTQFTATLTGIPGGASGRIAFRYFVTGGGPSGNNSNYIGVDTYSYTSQGGPNNIFCDDFEAYTVGQKLAQQNPVDWTTWSNAPGGAEDPFIVNNGGNVVEITGTNDLVHVMPNYTAGFYAITFDMYVPTGFVGYFNTLHLFSGAASSWGMQVYFDNGGAGSIDGGAAAAATFTFSYNTWMGIKVNVDLDNDWAEFFVNDVLIHGWAWSTGAFGQNNLNQLGGSNFYAWAEGGGTPKYHFDNYCLTQVGTVLPAPTNLVATVVNDNNVHLTWSAPAGATDLQGYNVYRNGTFLALVAVPATQYDDNGLSTGTYNYYVKAKYPTGESAASNTATAVIVPNVPPAPTNLVATGVTNGVQLTWDGVGSGEWIHWDAGVNNGNAIGLTAGGTFSCASHWAPADLINYNGFSLQKVQFWPNADPAATFVIKVWSGANGTTLLHQQNVTSFVVDQWNEVVLTTPVLISAATDFWFGYSVTHGAGTFPAGTDDGPAVQGKGDMISTGGAWVSMGAQYGLDYNWNIAGFVGLADGKNTPLQPMIETIAPVNYNVSFQSAAQNGLANGPSVKFNPNSTKDFMYNVYHKVQGGTYAKLNATPIAVTTYLHVAPPQGWNYYVVRTINNGIESPNSNEASILWTSIEELVYANTRIYPNPASSIVNISSEFDIQSVRVYNHAGQAVASENTNTKFYQFDASQFTPGLYLFQIETAEGTITKRIIIE
jgi:hypothetical protein